MTSQDRYDSLLQWSADVHHLDDWRWSKAQLIAESGMDPKAVSRVGAQGIAQAMPATFRDIMGLEADPFNPETSIDFHASYLASLLVKFEGDRLQATAAYNCGPGRMGTVVKVHTDAWRSFLPAETTQYLRRIVRLYDTLRDAS